MPAFGLGVYQSSPGETASAVRQAVADGYRLVDTAAAYMNEKQVGEGLRASGVDRSEVFVTTKLWMSDYGYDKALHAFDRSLKKLGLDQLDLYLLHWPVPSEFGRTVQSWKAAERLLGEGRVRAIGVCNFSVTNLDRLAEQSDVVPAVNQVELHPFFTQPGLRSVHRERGIATQAWSPIGGVNRYVDGARDEADPLLHPAIKALAQKYGKSPAQIILRWQIEVGNSVIPKSVRPARIRENAGIFDFSLGVKEIEVIEALDTGHRGGPDPELVHNGLFNLTIED